MQYRVIKANQVVKKEIPINVETGVVQEETQKEPEIKTTSEDVFDAEAFRILSPGDLAGNNEPIRTENPPKINEENENNNIQEEEIIPPPRNRDSQESFLSAEARKSRHAAVLEKLRIKELELEALEEELREWETKLQEQEKELIQKEQEITQQNIKKRKDTEAECSQSLKMAKEAAESIKAAAKTEVEVMKKNIMAEAEAARQQGYQEGFEEGEEKGAAQGEVQGSKEMEIVWRDLISETEMIIKELQASRIGVLKASYEEILKLSIAFAKQVIKVAPMIQSDIILENINQAIYQIAEVDRIVLKINIRDKAMCEEHKDKLLSSLSGVRELLIVEDPTISPGGVKIETGVSTIDATIETQARALEKALLDHYESSLDRFDV